MLTPIPTHCDVIDTAHKIGLSLWADEKAAQTKFKQGLESVPAVLGERISAPWTSLSQG